MIRYACNRQVDPPAPFVHVSLRRPGDGPSRDDQPAQIDTAADRTVIPGGLVTQLGLVPADELPAAGFGGQVFRVITYLVKIQLRGLPPRLIDVLAHEGEPYILLGRDILNHHRLVLDGPGLALEIR
jgi:predicted aspartyl protease